MSDSLKLLRYNTGTDKQVFIRFKDSLSAVIFNATIVAYSSSAVADLVSVYKNQYIIDPQTHIFQHSIDAVQTKGKNSQVVLKKSVLQYFDELPERLKNEFLTASGELTPSQISASIDSLVESVYKFETEYVDKYIKKKEYDKYLQFVKLGPAPRVVIAPYFMLKSDYDDSTIQAWLEINRISAEKFVATNDGSYPVGIQLVIDKAILEREGIIDLISKTYEGIDAEFAFIWIDEFSSFQASRKQMVQFKTLLQTLTELGLKPIMAYGGYDAILLCSSDLPCHLYGVAHSVGYGESRAITPVGGGLPVNKYYFPPLHSRLNMSEVIPILIHNGYFSGDKKEAANRFYSHICSCKQCKSIIKDNIDNFYAFNDSVPFTIRGSVTRNRPTSDATFIAAMHFMYDRIKEWELVESISFKELLQSLVEAYSTYAPKSLDRIRDWCEVYGK